jgi:hypothetical protein
MNSEFALIVINILISTGFFIGVYKNKIDHVNKFISKINELEIKMARLEEKINFLIEKNSKHES